MYKVLIVSALQKESKVIKEEIKKLDLKNFKTSFLVCGVGNYNTILNLSIYLQKNKFDLVLNIGICGRNYDNKSLFSKNITDENFDEYKCIQITRIKNLSNDREFIVPNILNFGKYTSIASSEKVIYDSKLLGDEDFVDMESYGFEFVCNNFDIPRIIIKTPFDKIGIETKNFDINKSLKYLKNHINYKNLFDEIESYFFKNFSNNSFLNDIEKNTKNKILNHYNFTVSEKIIFEKKFNKFICLGLGKISDFFEQNKNLEKKVFLKNL